VDAADGSGSPRTVSFNTGARRWRRSTPGATVGGSNQRKKRKERGLGWHLRRKWEGGGSAQGRCVERRRVWVWASGRQGTRPVEAGGRRPGVAARTRAGVEGGSYFAGPLLWASPKE
jgi:hypothetical protein